MKGWVGHLGDTEAVGVEENMESEVDVAADMEEVEKEGMVLLDLGEDMGLQETEEEEVYRWPISVMTMNRTTR